MQIHDLGRLEIGSEPGRAAVAVVGAKQIALLSGLCVLRGTRVSYELLREAAWGEQAAVADATIENHVWRLRRAIQPGVSAARSCVRHEDGGYRLDLPPESVDSALFEVLVDASREAALRTEHHRVLELCARAGALWRDDPFVSIAQAPRFETAVGRFAELRAQLEERRVDALLALGDAEQAAIEGARLTASHPFRENLWAQRMTALVRLGRTEEALAVFQRVRSVLREELGLDPGRRLQELQRAIIAQEDPDPRPPTSSASPWVRAAARSPQQPWPLVGRQAESASVAAAVRDGRVLVLRGTAGVGRTRMLEEALRAARDAGSTVLRFVGTRSAASVPLGVFADLVPPDARGTDRLSLLQSCAAVLRERACGHPLLIGVDDAHLLDESSAALLLHLASADDIGVALTVKTEESAPDAIDALVRDADTHLVPLEPLDEQPAGRLFEHVLGGPADELLRRWAHRTARGNPFYIVALARGLRDDETVHQHDGRWIAESVPPIPPSLASLVQGALERLDAPLRDLVDRLALAEPMRVAALDADATLLVELEQQGLVVVEDRGHEQRVALAHPLFAAVLRETLPPLRARQVRRDLIARFVRREGLAPDERLRLATWRMQTGEAGSASETIDAAALALSFNDPGLTLRLLAPFDDGTGAEARGDVDVRLLRAQAHILRRDLDEAATALQGVEPVLRTSEQGAVYLEAQVEIGRFGRSQLDDPPALFERAARWWPGDGDWVRLVERLRLRDAIFEAQAVAETIDEETEPSESTRLGAFYYSGRLIQARALAAQIVREPPLLTLDEVASAAIAARVELDRGDELDRLESWLSRMRALAYDADDPAAAGIAAAKIADLRMLQGEAAQARELYAEAARQWERRDPIALRASAWSGISVASAQLGDAEAAFRALLRLREIAGETLRAHLVPYVATAEAAYAASVGDSAAATAHLDRAVARLAASPMHLARLHYERVLLGLGIDAAVAQAVRAATDASDSPLMRLYALHADALVRGDADGLRKASQGFGALGVAAYAQRALVDAARLG